MHSRRALRMVGIAGAGILLASGCTGQADEGGEPEPEERRSAVEAPDGPFVRSGVFGEGTEFRARLEIDAVERHDDRTVMRFTTTPLQEGEHNAKGGFGAGFRILDPMGQRVYEQLPNSAREPGDVADPVDEENYTPRNLGNDLPDSVMGDAAYEMEAHFAPLPEDTKKITVLTPGTAGGLTGVPVEEPPEPEDEDEGEEDEEEDDPEDGEEAGGVRAGDTVELPVVAEPLPQDPADYIRPLYGITESGHAERDTARTRERVTLRADDLFDPVEEEDGEEGEEEELKDEAAERLNSALDDARDRIDPDDPLLSIVGHTDGSGDDDANRELSLHRARLVHAHLEEELGEEFRYETEGRGGEAPVSDESGSHRNEARERNNRVEITYSVEPEPTEADEEDEGGGGDQESAGEDGEPQSEENDGEASEGNGEEDAENGEEEAEEEDPEGEGTDGDRGDETDTVPGPAPFRKSDGDAIASATGSFDEHEYRLLVKPFYRDGVYLVANFEVINKSRDEISEETDSFSGVDYPGAEFGEFSAVDPDSGDVYHGVRIGGNNTLGDGGAGRSYLDPVSYPYTVRTNSGNRAWFYMPAPPPEVTSVNFDAGEFGLIENVPIE